MVDHAQAVAFYRLAAAQGLDGAQSRLGYMYYNGVGVSQDYAEALRLYQLAAAQGHPEALFSVAHSHEYGQGVGYGVKQHKNKHKYVNKFYSNKQGTGACVGSLGGS